MAQPYLDQLEKLISAVAPSSDDLACKHFFSGAALYMKQNICATLTQKWSPSVEQPDSLFKV